MEPIAAATIPPPPPELIDWITQILEELFASLCPAPTPEDALENINNPSLRGLLRFNRAVESRFAAAGQSEDWDRYGRQWIRDLRRQARDLETDDVRFLVRRR